YTGGNDFNSGLGDYVLILDFVADEDKIQLHGSLDNYRLDASPQNLPQGFALYSTINDYDELIAIIQGTASLSLDDNDFQFV
ncbi:MAG: type I secretion protein, partial [Cyanobacteria bacterium J06592_8]